MLIDVTTGTATTLALTAAKAAAVLAAAAVATPLMRRASAAGRHLVWVLAVAVAVLLPAASLVLPAWRVAVLPAAVSNHVGPEPLAARGGSVAAPFAGADTLPQEPRLAGPPAGRGAGSGGPARRLNGTDSPASPILFTVGRPSRWPAIVLAVWAVGAGGVCVLWVVAAAATWRLGRRCPTVTTGPVFELAGQLRREVGVGRRVTVHMGGPGAMPITWGLVRPHLLLPADAVDWPAGRLRLVLLHELAHVRRHDCATQLLGQLCCAVHWFDPLAWYAARRLRAERERACDDAALRHGADPAAYAELLVSVATAARGRVGLPMARRAGLAWRVRMALDAAVSRRPVRRRAAVVGLTLAAAVLVPLAAVRVASRPAMGQVAPPHRPTTVPAKPGATAAGRDAVDVWAYSWQGGQRPDLPKVVANARRPGGRALTSAERSALESHRPDGLDVSYMPHPTPVDVLYLWFRMPGVDADAGLDVDVLGSDGRSLLTGGGVTSGTSSTPGEDGRPETWGTAAACVGTAHGRPVVADVRLRYAAGPWASVAKVPPDENGELVVGQRFTVAGVGQDKAGRAFVSIARDGPSTEAFDAIAHGRDGHDVGTSSGTSGNGSLTVQVFTAEVPLADVRSFEIRARPIRALLLHDVWLGDAIPATRAAAAAHTWEPTLANVPPVVVSTVPAAGATDVDPNTTEIRVTFSKRMADESWSWVQMDAATYPAVAGRPHYLADRRTCVLPVKLEPGRTYQVWVNSDEDQNFTDADGRAAVVYPLVFSTRGK